MTRSKPDTGIVSAGQRGKQPRTCAQWFDHGRRCFHAHDGLEAVRSLLKVTRASPGYRHGDGDNPYYYLGKIHEVEGRLGHAIIFYSRALAVDPLDEESLIGLGSCFTVTGRYEAAIYCFENLLRFPKGRRNIPQKHLFFVLSENCRRAGKWVQAVFWEHLAQLADPGNERQQALYNDLVAAVVGV